MTESRAEAAAANRRHASVSAELDEARDELVDTRLTLERERESHAETRAELSETRQALRECAAQLKGAMATIDELKAQASNFEQRMQALERGARRDRDDHLPPAYRVGTRNLTPGELEAMERQTTERATQAMAELRKREAQQRALDDVIEKMG